MTYAINHNGLGWYYDLLDHNGCEIECHAYFSTREAALVSAWLRLCELNMRKVA